MATNGDFSDDELSHSEDETHDIVPEDVRGRTPTTVQNQRQNHATLPFQVRR